MNKKPPKYPLRFFRWFCHPDYLEEIEGDLLERFEKRPSKWQFTLEVVRLIRIDLLRKLEGSIRLNYYGMLKHYLLVAFRGFRKERSYSLTNLFGLTLSISVSLLIWHYIENEYAVDSYHANSENKYCINYSYYEGDELTAKSATTTYALGPDVVQNINGIKNMVRVRPLFTDEGLVLTNSAKTKKFLEHGIYYVEDTFLEMFNFPLASGSKRDALSSPNNIVITPKTALKLFGEEDPMGKQLLISGGTMTGEFIVSGVLAELPRRTHFDFDYLIPIDFFLTHNGLAKREDGWHWPNYRTYFELENHIVVDELTTKIDGLIDERIGHLHQETNQSLRTSLQPIRDIYLDPFVDGDGGLYKGNASDIRIFAIVSLMILVVAGINYVNLASARSFRKKLEVAVRKAIGARRNQLIFQYLFESFLFNLAAFGISLFLTVLLTPTLHPIIGGDLKFNLVYTPKFWIFAGAWLIAVSVLTGLYPALLSIKIGSFHPKAKKGNAPSRGLFIRQSLIAFQLIVSLLMVAGTWLVFYQVTFMKNRELGIDMDQLFIIQGPRAVIEEGRDIMKVKQNRFKHTLQDHADIHSVSVSSNVPGTGSIWYGGVRKLGDPRSMEVPTDLMLVGFDFTEAYPLEFVAGGPFLEEMSDYEAVIINEQALKEFNLKEPHEALNHSVVLENMDTMKIHGVAKDIHWNSLHEQVRPTVFAVNDFPAFLSIKLNTKNLPQSLELIEETFHELYPNDPYISFFLDDEFNIQYESEQKFAKLFSAFSIIAIIISGLGLLALIVYSLGQKMKEVGIRKVLGASAYQLFLLLSKEYFFIFLAAIAIAIPIIYWSAHSWLENFAYRISIGLELFLLPILMVGFITCLVISRKIIIATRINPVEQLRDE